MTFGTGWLRELPDLRDWDALALADSPPLRADSTPPMGTSGFVDARKYCSPIENQGRLGSCTAQAVAGLAEYRERAQYGRHIDVSRLFIYKMARQIDGYKGDTGSHIRTAMKGLKLFGAPPERYWPYNVAEFDEDPTAFVFAYGQSLQATSYYKLDQPGRIRSDVLSLAKRLIVNYFPVVFGFRVYYSNERGEFPMPKEGDRPRGGHAVMAVGYDDSYKITDTVGALLIRNSWGTNWGDKGYGWLPYDYVLKHLSADFWTLFRKESVM